MRVLPARVPVYRMGKARSEGRAVAGIRVGIWTGEGVLPATATHP